MARFTKRKTGMKKVKKKRKIDKPFLLHVQPSTTSDDSIELSQHEPMESDYKPLVGSMGQSNLLFPAVVLVPSISGVIKPSLHKLGCIGIVAFCQDTEKAIFGYMVKGSNSAFMLCGLVISQ